MQGYKNYIAAGLEPKNYCFIAICKNDIENIIYSSRRITAEAVTVHCFINRI